MKKSALLTAFVLSILAFASTELRAQSETFSDPNVEYSFSVPDSKWKKITTPSASNPNVEYVYGDRVDGRLEIRKITVKKDTLITDVIHDEEQKLQFMLGYAPGKEENFSGRYRGTVFNFEFVKGGRAMSGRFYFLRANDTTVYVVRFEGRKDSLRSIQNETDSIARTFAVKP